MYRQIRWPLAYARIGLLYDYDYTHLHVYANVLDLLREVKNTVRQLSRVIPGRQPASKKTWNFKERGKGMRRASGVDKRDLSITSTAHFISALLPQDIA